jgi:proteic killer suppression protein
LIISFADQETTDIYNGVNSKKARMRLPINLFEKAQVKLDMLKKATCLQDLKSSPNNRLEKLEGNLKGKFSIRINDQYRIVFNWDQENRGVSHVKIVDYH